MNTFEELEQLAAKQIKLLAAKMVRMYAKPGDRMAAYYALLLLAAGYENI